VEESAVWQFLILLRWGCPISRVLCEKWDCVGTAALGCLQHPRGTRGRSPAAFGWRSASSPAKSKPDHSTCHSDRSEPWAKSKGSGVEEPAFLARETTVKERRLSAAPGVQIHARL